MNRKSNYVGSRKARAREDDTAEEDTAKEDTAEDDTTEDDTAEEVVTTNTCQKQKQNINHYKESKVKEDLKTNNPQTG